jgi:hypothetical protein
MIIESVMIITIVANTMMMFKMVIESLIIVDNNRNDGNIYHDNTIYIYIYIYIYINIYIYV